MKNYPTFRRRSTNIFQTYSQEKTTNGNFAESIQKILLPEKLLSSKQAPSCEWINLAKDEPSWLLYIDCCFETCPDTDFENPCGNIRRALARLLPCAYYYVFLNVSFTLKYDLNATYAFKPSTTVLYN